MSSEENPGKIASSSETRLSLDAKDHDDDDGTVRLVSDLAGDDSDDLKVAAQSLPLLQNLLLQNDIQRERLIGLIQLYDPTATEGRNVEGEQIATETDLSCKVHFLEQSLEKLGEELENQRKANAQLEDQIKLFTKSSDSMKRND